MKEIAAAEAETTLSALLDLAESGEQVVITRAGQEVARLVPSGATADRAAARLAAQRIREMSKGVTLGGLSIKDLINEGRR
jgi:prevent-host-death family protein